MLALPENYLHLRQLRAKQVSQCAKWRKLQQWQNVSSPPEALDLVGTTWSLQGAAEVVFISDQSVLPSHGSISDGLLLCRDLLR